MSLHANPHYVSIGDNTLIYSRNNAPLVNGKHLGAYIPFYFGPRMPMLYVIENGYKGVIRVPAAEIVYCVSSVEMMVAHGLDFAFTDGHASNKLSTQYGRESISQMSTLLDFEAIRSKSWISESDLDLKRRKEAEFLVSEDVPPTAISGFVVASEKAKEALLAFGLPKESVHVNAGFYFLP